jgi:hypothetical protein
LANNAKQFLKLELLIQHLRSAALNALIDVAETAVRKESDAQIIFVCFAVL